MIRTEVPGALITIVILPMRSLVSVKEPRKGWTKLKNLERFQEGHIL